MQILGLEKVRIMRFSGRKGGFEGVLSGSDPDARDKEKNCRKYATEMKNENRPLRLNSTSSIVK